MPSRSFFAAASAFLAGGLLSAAEITSHVVDVDILADGSYRAHTHLEVRLVTKGDTEAWSVIPIRLDQNRSLESLTGTVVLPDGATRKLRRSQLDTAGDVSGLLLASSSLRRVIRFTDVPPGSTIALDVTVLVRPYYPAAEVSGLRSALASTDRLTVSVRGGDARFRFQLSGDSTGLVVQPSNGGVTVTGANLALLTLPDDSPDIASAGPHLFFGWGREGTWKDVGRWWSELTSTMKPPGSGVAAAARQLALDGRPAGEAVNAVLAFVHAHVRYVAVELGIGGWLPADPETTLARGWGDCKALSMLTIALLRAAGIPAVPAAAAVSDGAVVDSDFPGIDSFDHVVVAVPASTLGPGSVFDDGRAYAFIDPTQTSPGLDRCPAHLRGRRLLLLTENAALLTAAALPELEARRLRVELTVAPDDSARGKADLELVGERAAAWLALAATWRPIDLERRGRQLMVALLPTANLLDFSWTREGGLGAAVVLTAHLAVPELVTDGRTSAWFQATGPVLAPPASDLASRSFPFLRSPQISETVWTMRLPEGWRLAPIEPADVSNPIAAFSETLQIEGRDIRLTRRTELRQGYVELSQIPLLQEVASAEHRAQLRRLLVERPPVPAPNP